MVVMPNHFHCIIEIVNGVGADLRVCPQSTDHHESDANVTSESNANVASESNVASGGRHIGLPLRSPILRQRNYWEHIIRNADAYEKIADYIVDNPSKWRNDIFYE